MHETTQAPVPVQPTESPILLIVRENRSIVLGRVMAIGEVLQLLDEIRQRILSTPLMSQAPALPANPPVTPPPAQSTPNPPTPPIMPSAPTEGNGESA